LKIERAINKFLLDHHFSAEERVVVAVSGGSDSLGMCLALGEVMGVHRILAVTINHNLRVDSESEAEKVGAWLKQMEISHEILKWQNPIKVGNLMQNAREARYQLLIDYCKKHNVNKLFVGHNLDDNIETFLMRLERGSGIDGLAGMEEVKVIEDIFICRPLLALTRREIREYLDLRKQVWIDDPTNENTDYLRVKVRSIFKDDASFYQRLSLAISNIHRSKSFISQYVEDRYKNLTNNNFPGIIICDLSQFLCEHEEIRMRILNRVIMELTGSQNKQRLTSIIALDKKLNSTTFKATNIQNLGIISSKNKIYFYRLKKEEKREKLPSNGIVSFDGYKIEVKDLPAGLEIGYSSAQTFAQYKKLKRKLPLLFPHSIMLNIPMVFDLEKIVFIPHISVDGGECNDAQSGSDVVLVNRPQVIFK
jgi:tRNA(Ile)-lysidine synthase